MNKWNIHLNLRTTGNILYVWQSRSKKSRTVEVPDFTSGTRQINKPVEFTLSKGATTTVISVKPDLKMK